MDPESWLTDSEGTGFKPPGDGHKQKLGAHTRQKVMRTASGRLQKSGSHGDLPTIESGRTLGGFQHALMTLDEEHEREIRAMKARCDVELAALRLELGEAGTGSGGKDRDGDSRHWAVGNGFEDNFSEAPSFADVRIGVADDSDPFGAKARANSPSAGLVVNGHAPGGDGNDIQQHVKSVVRIETRDLMMAEGWMPKAQESKAHLPPAWRQPFIRMVRKPNFDMVCAVCILANSALWACRVNEAALNHNPLDVSGFYLVANKVFVFWFLLELIARLAADGFCSFASENVLWNFFDLILVAIDCVELIITASAEDEYEDNPPKVIVRVLRVFRIAKSLRMLRIFSFVRELRMMVFSVMKGFLSMTWAFLFLFLLIFVFSVFLMQNTTAHLYESRQLASQTLEQETTAKALEEMFGSLAEAIYTLFKVISGGIVWGEVGKHLIAIHWANGVVLSLYVFIFVFALANIVIGVFVETMLTGVHTDRDEAIRQQLRTEDSELSVLRRVFMDCNKEKDSLGFLTYEDFSQLLQDKQVCSGLKSLGMDGAEAEGLFRLLDMDCSGSISVDEFIHGLMRLKGGAKNIDFCTLMYENKRLALKLQSSTFNEGALDGLKGFILRSNKDQVTSLLQLLALEDGMSSKGSSRQPVTPRTPLSLGLSTPRQDTEVTDEGVLGVRTPSETLNSPGSPRSP